MDEIRRNSQGQELGARAVDLRSYDQRQLGLSLPEPPVEDVIPDTVDRRIDWFLNRWSWRTDRDVVRRELVALIEFAKVQA